MSEIFEHLAQLGVAFRLPGRWAFLPPHASVRRLPRDTGRVLSALRSATRMTRSRRLGSWGGMEKAK